MKFLTELFAVPSAPQTLVASATGILGSILTYAFGGWSELLSFFLLAIAIDYATGVAAAIKEKSGLSSDTGFWGLLKKALMIMAVFMAHRADIALEMNILMYGTLYAFLLNEIISIAENCGRLGVPLPQAFKNMITVLQGRAPDASHKPK